MDKNQRISELIAASLLGQLSADGQAELDSWLSADASHRQFYDSLTRDGALGRELDRLQQIDREAALQAMLSRINGTAKTEPAKKPVLRVVRWLSAAAVAVVIAGGAYVAFHRHDKAATVASVQPTEITHGSTRAYIILDDGERISLGANSHADSQALERISRGGYDGRITMHTPRGGEFAMTLPDSTEVWLNAESSISYPATFDATKRSVSITGEAYFRVRHDDHWPFEVETGGQTVRVLGTEFNINAYDRAHILTTLFSGSVAVSADGSGQGFMLAPGETASFTAATKSFTSTDADTAAVRGWLHGRFVFENQSLGRIMRELSRWYNFTYRFSDRSLASTVFMGTVPRYGDFREVLDILEKSGGITFKVKGREVIVQK